MYVAVPAAIAQPTAIDLREQRAPERRVEPVPDPVGHESERHRGDEHRHGRAQRPPHLEAAQQHAQPLRLQRGHHGARDRGADHDPGDPERPVQRERDDRVDDQREHGQPRRDPRPLQREERARQQQVRAGEGQREGEPEQRRGHQVGRLGAELPALVDQPRQRRREHRGDHGGRDQRQRDLAHAGAARAAQAAAVAAGGQARHRREEHGRDRHREDALRQHVEPERTVDRGGRLVAHERAEDRVDHEVEVDDPEPDRHRQHQHEDVADPRVVPAERDAQVEADPAQHREAHPELHRGPRHHAARVPVELVGSGGPAVADHQRRDDHEVPDHGRERRDREVVVGLQHAHHEPVEAQQHHDREQDLGEADRQVVERRGERVAGEQRHQERRDQDEDDRHRTQRHQDQAEQRAGERERVLLAPLLEQLGEDRHEGRGERRVRHQRAQQVRHLERERERRERARRAEVARGDHLAHQAGDARQARQG